VAIIAGETAAAITAAVVLIPAAEIHKKKDAPGDPGASLLWHR